jgi:prevent-host-death family protein
MKNVGIKEARQNLPGLIDQVEAGEEIIITRSGKAVAKLVPAPIIRRELPSLTAFRQSIGTIGTPSSRLLREDRDQQ